MTTAERWKRTIKTRKITEGRNIVKYLRRNPHGTADGERGGKQRGKFRTGPRNGKKAVKMAYPGVETGGIPRSKRFHPKFLRMTSGLLAIKEVVLTDGGFSNSF